jgi:hypothetical protein
MFGDIRAIKRAHERGLEMKECRRLNTREAAEYLGLSPRTLERLRLRGGGPIYEKPIRRCLYRIDALDAWASAAQRRSTSDPGPSANNASV